LRIWKCQRLSDGGWKQRYDLVSKKKQTKKKTKKGKKWKKEKSKQKPKKLNNEQREQTKHTQQKKKTPHSPPQQTFITHTADHTTPQNKNTSQKKSTKIIKFKITKKPQKPKKHIQTLTPNKIYHHHKTKKHEQSSPKQISPTIS